MSVVEADDAQLLRRGSLSSSSETAFDSSSIHILLSMKHASEEQNETAQAPPSQEEQMSANPQTCTLSSCLICSRGVPNIVYISPTWSTIMRVVFYTLKNANQEKQYFNLRTDVYSFMSVHWEKLCLSKDPSINWKKQIQDMLSHSKNLFESGTEHYKQNGYWRLKPSIDPWTIEKPQRDKSRPKSNGKENGSKKRSSPSSSATTSMTGPDTVVAPAPKQAKTEYVDAPAGSFLEKVQVLKSECDNMCVRMKGLQGEINSRDVKTEDSVVFSRIMNDLGRMQDALKSDAETMKQEITSKFQSNMLQSEALISLSSSPSRIPTTDDQILLSQPDMLIPVTYIPDMPFVLTTMTPQSSI